MIYLLMMRIVTLTLLNYGVILTVLERSKLPQYGLQDKYILLRTESNLNGNSYHEMQSLVDYAISYAIRVK